MSIFISTYAQNKVTLYKVFWKGKADKKVTLYNLEYSCILSYFGSSSIEEKTSRKMRI